MVEQAFARQKKNNSYAAMVVEPLIQGAAGMIPQPSGWLRRIAEIVHGSGAQLIADEVMTGFGRTGMGATQISNLNSTVLFACHQEQVQPDFLALAKGLTGGYLPMAATLTTNAVCDAFLGEYSEFKTFFHGHSYTANQLGSAAALASLKLLRTSSSLHSRQRIQQALQQSLESMWELPYVGDIRQVGLIAGIELVRNWHRRTPFELRDQAGIRVCQAMARRGVLTRPIGNVVVLMPPYCTKNSQIEQMVATLRAAICEVLS